MPAELLLGGYYRGPKTYLDSYTFLKLYRGQRWAFAEAEEPTYDFPGRLKALGLEAVCWERPSGFVTDRSARLLWGRYKRGTDVPLINSTGGVVGCLADALEAVHPAGETVRSPFQVQVVGPGQLRPTTHNVTLTYVADELAEPGAAPNRSTGRGVFACAAFSPSWRTATAVALARRIDESDDFGAMPILADALQDAGCDSDDILGHCRGPHLHARGCWVIDLVIGKQ